MPYNNPKELLTAATALPAAIEAKLPTGAPALSARMIEAINKMPALPDFPMALPDLPPVPQLPGPPGGGEEELRRMPRYVTEVTVAPSPVAPAAAAQPRSRRYLY